MSWAAEAESVVYQSPQRLCRTLLRSCLPRYRPWMATATGKTLKQDRICHQFVGGVPALGLGFVC